MIKRLTVLCLLSLAATAAAHASIGSPPSHRPVDGDATQAAERKDVAAVPATGVDAPAPPRRTRMADAQDPSTFRLSAAYIVKDERTHRGGDCPQYTGSRVKREGDGKHSCSGQGQVFVPDR